MSILTVSREFGSGGREIGHGVAEKLNYEYIDKEQILQEVSFHGNQWEQWAKGLDEHAPTLWERFDWSFRGFGALLRSIILTHALNDNAVIMGRAGNIIVADVPYAFRIRVVAPLDSRLDRIMIRESVDYDTALWLAQKTDKDRGHFLKAMFGADWNSPQDYDAVFDTGKTSIPDAVDSICEKLEKRREARTEEAVASIKTRTAAARIEAGILTYPLLFVNMLEVVIEGKDLVLKGVVRDPKHRKKVEEIALNLAGDIPLKVRLTYRGL